MGIQNLHLTVLTLLNSSNNWHINIDKGDTNGVIFLDIKKAFNAIDHSISLEKLSHYGVSEDSLLFIKSYSINRHNAALLMVSYLPLGKYRTEFPKAPFWVLCCS